jgi:Arc/MetJ-type ribon-helix-helix transcriptional regulator
MEIHPTPDQEAFIRQAVDDGRIARPEEAVTQAMALWEEHERRRAEILARIDEAEFGLRRGQGIVITPESMDKLAEDVKQRGRARLDAENARRR